MTYVSVVRIAFMVLIAQNRVQETVLTVPVCKRAVTVSAVLRVSRVIDVSSVPAVNMELIVA